jgi:uncharacterized protein
VPQISLERTAARRSALTVLLITIVQGACILYAPRLFLRPLATGGAGLGGWLCAAAAALIYIGYSVRGLALQPYLRLLTPFRLLGPLMAVPTSILEEVFFRQLVMDALMQRGAGASAQVLISGLIFGAAHAVWGLRGGLVAARNAIISTTFLGIMLAIVYLACGRTVLPCVLAHFSINCVLEPWLIYAYTLRAQQRAR